MGRKEGMEKEEEEEKGKKKGKDYSKENVSRSEVQQAYDLPLQQIILDEKIGTSPTSEYAGFAGAFVFKDNTSKNILDALSATYTVYNNVEDVYFAKAFPNDPDRRKHSFDFRREDVEVIDGYFEEQKSSTGYDLYHRDFSSAMQHAYDHAKKKFGITIDKDEIDDKVAMGPRKPSKGKTNSYRLKGDKGNVQVQVYNMGSKFELNMYKEEVVEAFDPADFDIKATSKDKEQADQNILIQLQKVISLRGMKPVEFANGSKQKVDPNIAAKALSMHQKLRRTDEKDAFQRKIGKSYRDLLNAVKGRK